MTSTPEHAESMRAVAFHPSQNVAGPSRLVDVTVPRPDVGSRDLLVEVRAVSVNPVDIKVQDGGSDDLRILGFDAAGTVVAVGEDVTLFSPGDEVWYAGSIARPGTNAEFHAVDERIAGRKPSTLDFAEAAAMPLTAITAWEGLFDKLRLDSTSTGTMLLIGASGGVGSMVLQLAEALLPGVRVIATSSTAESDEWVRDLGAEVTVNHREGDLLEQVRTAAPEGIDWVFTSRVADPGQLDLYVDVLKPFGQIVAIDDPESLDIAFLKSKSITFHWELMFTKALAGGDLMTSQHTLLDEVADLVDAGRIRTTVTTVLSPIDAAQLREAHRRVEGGRTIGKIAVSR
ncbi:zinc-binding alcohol dehydrogenase family protein [Nocardioides flavescens]|uniref:Zinc-type alcohol dehydrogenase-like protein n=1 Tax=Nocardioides flavescens TaxID=2691959 RepID=A0A6L7F194_9ACTN|nr:zinc-binding alcohol dehydrogenase family protein [Nocardioides flavescens]MXG90879.1 zinc-binding alcohol dehydrogenase family protein [Nocardioides flavescens]